MNKQRGKFLRLGVLAAAGLALCLYGSGVQAQTAKTDSARTVPSQVARGEGELIELEAVQIHGEIAQPNVAITVARAKPLFREITLERTPAEALSELELSGLKEGTPPPDRIRHWKELVNRRRR
jgi:hypothetical protein